VHWQLLTAIHRRHCRLHHACISIAAAIAVVTTAIVVNGVGLMTESASSPSAQRLLLNDVCVAHYSPPLRMALLFISQVYNNTSASGINVRNWLLLGMIQ
jgi:hypothetical protein